jgi:hypothetical protein
VKIIALLFSALSVVTVAAADPAYALKEVASGFTSPVGLIPIKDGSGRLIVVDQAGSLTLLSREGTKTLFFDATNFMTKVGPAFDERGLLGLALHPRFNENKKLYVYYSAPLQDGAPKEWNCTSHISEFKVVDNKVDPKSERLLLKFDKPYFNHNGGCIVFGPDGFLYIGVGDGGNANDQGLRPEHGNGQDTSTLLGKILRIDVDHGDPYGIPTDNPFAKEGGRPEIFAFGMRNPWRITFDRGGEYGLLAADIGQTLYEEVDLIVRGGNYGWNLREGFHGFDPKNPNTSPEPGAKTDTAGRPLLDPVFEYKNKSGWRNDPEALGVSITGGYIYRGKALPELQGLYVFGDWSAAMVLPQGHLLLATPTKQGSGKPWTVKPLDVPSSPANGIGAYITAFGEDEEGEIYVLTNGRNTLSGSNGKVWRLVRGPS